jgi:hypothetical protein
MVDAGADGRTAARPAVAGPAAVGVSGAGGPATHGRPAAVPAPGDLPAPAADRTAVAAPTAAAVRSALVCCAESGAGKTSWTLRLIAAARARDLSVAGIVTTVEHDSGARRWIEDLGSGERRLLGYDGEERVGPDGCRWVLSNETLAWGDARLRATGEADVLVIDEVGPVELLHRRGWWGGAAAALAGPARLALVTVRPPLLGELAGLLIGRSVTIIEPDAPFAFPAAERVLAQAVPSQPQRGDA